MALSTFFGRAIQKALIQPDLQAKIAADPTLAAGLAANRLVQATGASLDPVVGAQLYREAVAKQEAATMKGIGVIAAVAAPLVASSFGALPGGAPAPELPAPVPSTPPIIPTGADMSLSTILRDAAKTGLTSLVSNFLPGGNGGQVIPDFGPIAGASLPVQQVSLPALGGILPMASRLLPSASSLLSGAARAAVGLVRTVSGRIRGVMLSSGRFISSKKGVALAKRVGIDAAAAALGISAVEMAQMVLDESSTRSGRGRGVTAAQIRTTRRTMRTVMGLHKQLVAACSSSGMVKRRSCAPRARRR